MEAEKKAYYNYEQQLKSGKLIMYFFITFIVKMKRQENDKKTLVTIEAYKRPISLKNMDENDILIYTRRSEIAHINFILYKADKSSILKDVKNDNARLIQTITQERKKRPNEIDINEYLDIHAPTILKLIDKIAEKYQAAHKELLKDANKMLESNAFKEKYIKLYNAIKALKTNRRNKATYLIYKSLKITNDEQAKAFNRWAKNETQEAVNIALLILIDKSLNDFNFNPLLITMVLAKSKSKYERKTLFKKVYEKLFLKNFEQVKDKQEAKALTMSQMPNTMKEARELLKQLDKDN